jgi:hypothetical protein
MLGGNLRRRRRRFEEDDANPMEGAINIVDAMLVFACGLMLSLVIYWNVDIQNHELVPVEQGASMSELGDIAEDIENNLNEDGKYEKMGVVYVDPVTGKMYLVQEEEDTQNE